jgi:hypothetical protein
MSFTPCSNFSHKLNRKRLSALKVGRLAGWQVGRLQANTFNLQPSTFNLQPSTFNLQPSTFNLQPSNLQPY